MYSGIEFILKVWVVLFIVGVDGLDEQLERNKDRDKIKDKIIERKDFIEKESSLKIQFWSNYTKTIFMFQLKNRENKNEYVSI